MMTDSAKLSDIINARRVMGRKRFQQAILVAKELGERRPKRHGAWYHYRTDGLSIRYDDYGGNMTCKHKGLQVLDVHLSTMKGFVPGAWEGRLEALYMPLAAREERRDQVEKEGKQAEYLAKWGIRDLGGFDIMRRIYIASSWKNRERVRELATILRNDGHEVFAFTDHENRDDGLDRFVFGAREWAKYSGKAPDEIEYKDFLTWEPTQRAFASDKAGLDWANTVVMLLPCGRSSHLEAGYCVGQGKELFIYGDLPVGEFDAMYGFAKQCFWLSEEAGLLKVLRRS